MIDNTDPILRTAEAAPLGSTLIEQQIAGTAPPIETSTNTPPPPDIPKPTNKRTFAKIMSVIVLLVGVSTGLILMRQSLFFGSRATNCGQYTFEVTREGQVNVKNNTDSSEAFQRARVYINSVEVAIFDVPATASGETKIIGNITPPSDSFDWRVAGTTECSSSGIYSTNTQLSATCGTVEAYDQNWNKLTTQQLKDLKPSTVIRFSISGTTTGGSFDSAQFTLNGVQRSITTNKRPGTNDYYDEYTIPNGVTSFSVTAKMHHTSLGWI